MSLPDFYSPGQLSVIVPHCNFTPEWLLLGGPADANEALTARVFWPQCRVIAFEPNPEAYRWQLENVKEWSNPESEMALHHVALSDKAGVVQIGYEPGNPRNAIQVDADEAAGSSYLCPCNTLDSFDEERRPISEAVLWLDVEGNELDALLGAKNLFERGAIRLVNVEVQARREDKNAKLRRLLKGWGFRIVHRWNDSPSCADQVWVKKKHWPLVCKCSACREELKE